MICMNRIASGAYRTIWRIELTATRIAQYSVSPPARPVQIRTLSEMSAYERADVNRSFSPLQYSAPDRPRSSLREDLACLEERPKTGPAVGRRTVNHPKMLTMYCNKHLP